MIRLKHFLLPLTRVLWILHVSPCAAGEMGVVMARVGEAAATVAVGESVVQRACGGEGDPGVELPVSELYSGMQENTRGPAWW